MIPQKEMLHPPFPGDPANTKGREIVDQIFETDEPSMTDFSPVFRVNPEQDRFGPVMGDLNDQQSS